MFSCVWLFVTPWTIGHKAPLSLGFPRQEYWNALSFPSAGDPPHPGIEPGSPTLQADSLPTEPPGKPNVSVLLGNIIGNNCGFYAIILYCICIFASSLPLPLFLLFKSFLKIFICSSEGICVHFQSLINGFEVGLPKRLSGKDSSRQWRRNLSDPELEDSLKKETATHSSTLAWEISWTEELGVAIVRGVTRVGHDFTTKQTIAGFEVKRSADFCVSLKEIKVWNAMNWCFRELYNFKPLWTFWGLLHNMYKFYDGKTTAIYFSHILYPHETSFFFNNYLKFREILKLKKHFYSNLRKAFTWAALFWKWDSSYQFCDVMWA